MNGYIHNVVLGDSYVNVLDSQLIQWSYGQVLRIQGNLPPTVQIHFSLQEAGGKSVTRVAVTHEGVTEVFIPDFIVENKTDTNYKAFAYIYISDGQHGTTTHKIVMSVNARPKPEAYIEKGN